MLSTVEEFRGYDFLSPENAERWRGIFMQPLRKVLEQVHPTLKAEDSALVYVETLCLRLLGMLCAIPSPLCVQDVEERVARTFPTPIDKWALADARDTVDRTKKKKSLLPTEKLHQMLQKEVLLYKIDISVSIFMVAILEYICADILKLAGTYVKKISQKSGYFSITCQDIKTAMCADKVLMDMFYQDEELIAAGGGGGGGGGGEGAPRRSGGRCGSLTYAELVRDLLNDERHFLRELHLIIRVFKEEIERIVEKDSKAVRLIFANIVDIYELTVTLLGNLEDAMEMAQDSPTPYIGSCFEELAEVEEFRAYVRYANMVTKQKSRDTLQNIVDDPELSERLATAGHGFRLAVKYYLPKLLMAPIAHIFLYHNYVQTLHQIAPTVEDRESFKQVVCNLEPIKKVLVQALQDGPKLDSALRMATRAKRQLAIEKTNELSRLIDNWDSKELGQCCNEFIREDTLSKIGPGKRIADRRAYLFDGLLLLCKPVTSLVNVGGTVGALGGVVAGGGASSQLKLKEKLHLRKVEVLDRNDTEELKHCVELAPRCGGSVVLACASVVEKRNWMSDLVMLNTKSMLDRTLDSILLDLEKKHPLKLPSPEIYKFAVEDSTDNIVLEERTNNAGAPLIKGATLLKLVERLTYHIYADLTFMRTFLTTYRSFCEPTTLLDLLIERFNIPEPNLVYDTPEVYLRFVIEHCEFELVTIFTQAPRSKTPKYDRSPNSSLLEIDGETIDGVIVTDTEKLSKNTAREDWKRYRKEFLQPVKFRVINVLRHWVDQHFYDFERDPTLLDKLKTFLESVEGKPMKKWVQSVLKTIQRKMQGQAENDLNVSLTSVGGASVQHVFNKAPPQTERHVCECPERFNWHPLSLHPLEMARQLTLLEFDLYRTVRPSELVGAVWMKKDKEKTSPNLLRIIKHTTNFTLWMEKWIVESENLEERVGVVCRLIELGIALHALNNFNGVLACVAAMESASVHRLRNTFQMVSPRLEKALDECRELGQDHFKKYQERLRSINPPCVPFCGMYLTNILHIEDGNKDFLPNSELINFSKRRKVAEITGEIQQYQNQPYCLTVEPKTRAFLESLSPFPDMDDKDITDYLYEQSLKIEPRPPVKQLPKFPRRYPDLSVKLRIKSSRRHTSGGHSHHHDNSDDTSSVSQLSPTSMSGWDSSSVSSLNFGSVINLQDEDHKGSSLISPRLDRSNTNAFSLIEKHLGFFEKGTQKILNKHSSNNATSPSGREPESTSPRLPSTSIPELSGRLLDNFCAAPPSPRHCDSKPAPHPPNGKRPQTEPWPEQRLSFAHDPLPTRLVDLSCEAKHQRIVNDIINSGADRPSKPPALSPRNPIVDASVFYGTDNRNFGEFGSPKRSAPGAGGKSAAELCELRVNKPPALSPRTVDRSTKPRCESISMDDEVPPLMPRVWAGSGCAEGGVYGNSADCRRGSPERAPAPPERQPRVPPQPACEDRPLGSPAIDGIFRMPTMSPKRSPAPAPPHSPHVNVSPGNTRNAFSFPSRAPPTPSPGAPPPLTPHHLSACSTPPPLPPRRRRDSTPAPPTPHPLPVVSSGGVTPPPLPPRPTPAPAPELLRPAQSTILQRRHHNSEAPEKGPPSRPPKPSPPPAVTLPSQT